jgi:hypothetical protein
MDTKSAQRPTYKTSEGGAAVSDTPRTDAAIREILQTGQHNKVKADFARQLERELAEVTATLNEVIAKTNESHT